jgi:hypothetical protein
MPDPARLECSRLYSEELGIDLSAQTDDEYFRWFLASLLFGGHIGETIARRTYHSFCHHRLTTPRRILAAGWDFLVNPIMREGGYVRYDFSKSDQILRDCQKLVDEYDGSLWQVHETARDANDLESRLLGHGEYFPSGIAALLAQSRPVLLPVVVTIATSLGIDLGQYGRKTLTFARIEAGLIRLRREHRRLATAPSDVTRPAIDERKVARRRRVG